MYTYKFKIEQNGWSPLQVASQHGHTAVAKVLLDGDAQVDFQTKVVCMHRIFCKVINACMNIDGLDWTTYCYSRRSL